jgi:hypothetical protein
MATRMGLILHIKTLENAQSGSLKRERPCGLFAKYILSL